MSTSSLVIERYFQSSCEELYEAWTDPKVMQQWFFVQPTWTTTVESQLETGGQYKLVMKEENGEEHTMTGEYIELTPHSRIVFSWSSHVASDTRITIELEPVGDQTRLRLTHEGLPNEEAKQAHGFGWEGCLGNLQALRP